MTRSDDSMRTRWARLRAAFHQAGSLPEVERHRPVRHAQAREDRIGNLDQEHATTA